MNSIRGEFWILNKFIDLQKTIVKKLDSIQSFGAMNILCTDKTGTLTEDKIVLEKYLDVKGNEDIRVLRYAFLNSYFLPFSLSLFFAF